MGGILTPKNQKSTSSSTTNQSGTANTTTNNTSSQVGSGTSSQQVNLPPYIQQAYYTALGNSQNAAATPYTPYSGNTVAPFSDLQNSAFAGLPAAANAANPYLAGAAGLVGASTQGVTPQAWSPGAIQQYESPYLNDVINSTQNQFNLQNAQAQTGLKGNAASSNALGGDRVAVAQAQLAGQQQTAQAPVIAGLENQNYQQATNEFNTQQQTGLAAQEANAYTGLYGAGELGNLGELAQGTGLAGIGAELQAGGLQQAQTQAQLNVPYQNYLTAQQYPFYTSSFLNNATAGLGSIFGADLSGQTTNASTGYNNGSTSGTSTDYGTSSGTQTQPGQSLLGQLLGAGVAAAGLGAFGSGGNSITAQNFVTPANYSAFGQGSAPGFFGWLNGQGGFVKGGRVKALADGGDTDDDYSSDEDTNEEEADDAELASGEQLPPSYTPQYVAPPRAGLAAAATPPPAAAANPPAQLQLPPQKYVYDQNGMPTPQLPGKGLNGAMFGPPTLQPVPQATPSPRQPSPSGLAVGTPEAAAATGIDPRRLGMLSAGLGMMAAKGYPLAAIGEGGLAGVNEYEKAVGEQRQELAMEGQLGYRQSMSQAATTRAEALAEHYSNADKKPIIDRTGDTVRLIYPGGEAVDTGLPNQVVRTAKQRVADEAAHADVGSFQWNQGEGPDPNDPSKTVQGSWRYPTRSSGNQQPQFFPGVQAGRSAGPAGTGGGVTGQLVVQLQKDHPGLSTQDALAIIKDPSGQHADAINHSADVLAGTMARNDPNYGDDPEGTIDKYRKYYGVKTNGPPAKGGSTPPPSPAKLPAPVGVPPKLAQMPDGTTAPNGGFMWKKQGNQMIPIGPINSNGR